MAAVEQVNPQGTGETVIMDVLKTMVVKPHRATDETQLELKVNDIVYVLEQDVTGWWGGHKEGEECTGWFPGSCVRPVIEPPAAGHQPLATGSMPDDRLCSTQAAQHTSASSSMPDEGPSAHPALETGSRSPLRRSLLVASPQRGGQQVEMTQPGATAGTSVDPTGGDAAGGRQGRHDYQLHLHGGGGCSSTPSFQNSNDVTVLESVSVETLAAENTKLKQENTELNDAMKLIKRQSDVDRRNCSELEAAMQQERERREQMERRLQAESAEKDSISNEASLLREQLEKERRRSEAQNEAIEHMRRLYESKLQDKEAELRKASEHLESHRRSVQSEKQRARSLEEQLQLAQQELEAARQHGQAEPAPPVPTAIAEDVPMPEEPGLPQAVVTDETRRRLFSSTASTYHMPTPASSDRAGQYFDGFVQASPAGSPAAEVATRGRALTAAGRGAPTLGGCLAQPVLAASAGSRCSSTHRPPEPPRAASSAPRAGGRSTAAVAAAAEAAAAAVAATARAASPGRLGHARSTGDLTPHHRSASSDGSHVSTREEAPPRGCVADKVTMFEQRCQTPRRDGSEMHRQKQAPRSEPHEVRPSRSSREDRSARATPPVLPRPMATAPLPAVQAQAIQAQEQAAPQQAVPMPQQQLQQMQAAAQQQPSVPTVNIQAMAAQYQARMTTTHVPEQVHAGRPGSRPPRGLELPPEEEDEEPAVDQVNFGMSPIRRPQEINGQMSTGSVYQEAVQAAAAATAGHDVQALGGAGAVTLVASTGVASMVRHTASRESSIPEVSVLERIRQLEIR